MSPIKQTGLLDECKQSTINEAQAEDSVLKFLADNGVEALGSPLAGNSIHCDRMFLHEHMPRIDQYLNYRLIDVSTVKELVKRWKPSLFAKMPRKKTTHRGTDDIRESIEEARFYKKFLFNLKTDFTTNNWVRKCCNRFDQIKKFEGASIVKQNEILVNAFSAYV